MLTKKGVPTITAYFDKKTKIIGKRNKSCKPKWFFQHKKL